MRLLLVEDDPMIGESLEEGLKDERYAVDWVRDGRQAELALDSDVYDLVVLDLGLPKKHGFDVLSTYRSRCGRAPVLIVTARDATCDRVRGLDTGADDYLVKPFDIDELFARVRALLRRRAGRASPTISHCGLVLNPATREVRFNGNPLELSAREFALLQSLLDPPGHVVSKTRLEEQLYGWNQEVESNIVDVYVHRLRRKLGGSFIQNVRGVGYKVRAKA